MYPRLPSFLHWLLHSQRHFSTTTIFQNKYSFFETIYVCVSEYLDIYSTYIFDVSRILNTHVLMYTRQQLELHTILWDVVGWE